MKANVETMEPTIRPVTSRVRSALKSIRTPRFVAVARADATLFHAWRA